RLTAPRSLPDALPVYRRRADRAARIDVLPGRLVGPVRQGTGARLPGGGPSEEDGPLLHPRHDRRARATATAHEPRPARRPGPERRSACRVYGASRGPRPEKPGARARCVAMDEVGARWDRMEEEELARGPRASAESCCA